MTRDTELEIQLDRKHFALRSADRWLVQRQEPDGTRTELAHWDGGRRSLFHFLEQRGIVPTREAEAALAVIPESSGFRDRS